MAHVFRFYIPPDAPVADEVTLEADEAHHAIHVARVRQGEAVSLFDGQGREWDGVVARVTRREAIITVGSERIVAPPVRRLTLVQAWVKRDKCIESIIQRGTELGVSRFCFFTADHSERSPHGQEKWRRYAIESCKQCGRLWAPEFDETKDLVSALEKGYGNPLIATKDEPPRPLREVVTGAEIALIVGPEGDFSLDERKEALGRGAAAVSFGSVTYRSEAAAILGATLILRELGEFDV